MKVAPVDQSKIIRLPSIFNPTQLMGDGSKIWRGPPGGNGLGDEEEVYEPNGLEELDVGKMLFDSFLLKCDGSRTHGETRLYNAKNSGKILLGGRAAMALWTDYREDREKSALEWLRRNREVIGMGWPGNDRDVVGLTLGGVVLCGSSGACRSVLIFSYYAGKWQLKHSGLDQVCGGPPYAYLEPGEGGF